MWRWLPCSRGNHIFGAIFLAGLGRIAITRCDSGRWLEDRRFQPECLLLAVGKSPWAEAPAGRRHETDRLVHRLYSRPSRIGKGYQRTLIYVAEQTSHVNQDIS